MDKDNRLQCSHRERVGAAMAFSHFKKSVVRPRDVVLVSIGDLLEQAKPEQLSKLKLAFEGLTRQQLDTQYAKRQREFHRKAVWFMNCEYTRRLVPPSSRKIAETDLDSPMQVLDAMACDLQWVAKRHPHHRVLFQGWRQIKSETKFHSTVKFICYDQLYGAKHMYRALKGLNFDEDIQAECHYFVGMPVASRARSIESCSADVKAELEDKYMATLHRTRGARVDFTVADHRLIDRRMKIWRCGVLTKWSPVETGRLYDTLPGYLGVPEDKPMTRQRAAKFIEIVKRDVPKRYWKP